MVERQLRAKRGEPDYRNPIGGIPGDNRFSVSLKILMEESGYRMQSKWADHLGVKRGRLSEWITGKHIPTREQMEVILKCATDKDHLQADLIEAWEEQALKRGPRNHIVGKKLTYEPKTPVAKWVKNFSDKRGVSLKKLSLVYSFRGHGLRFYDSLSLESMVDIIEQSQSELCATQTEVEELCEAVAQTIEDKVRRGKYFTKSPYYKRFRSAV